MEVNINNYEEIVIDFLDGKLDEITLSNLYAFLENNPNLKADFELLTQNDLIIEPENSDIDFSSLLKKEKINVADYSEKLIAFIENDLNKNEKESFTKEINTYPELAAELALFNKTKLVVENDLVFAYKKSLLKKGGFFIIPLINRYSAVAAVFIAVIMVIYFLNNTNNSVNFANKSENSIVNSKQDSIKDILKSKNNIPHQLQQENEKQVLAFGGINPATIQKKKSTQPINNQIKNQKKITKENPLNNNNGQSVVPNVVPKKVVTDKLVLNNSIALNDKAELKNENIGESVLKVDVETPKISAASNENIVQNNEYNIANIASYVKEQLVISSKSEVIAVNQPQNLNENISLGETLGLNVLSLFNKVSNKNVKVKKTYNKEGEVENIKLVATGW